MPNETTMSEALSRVHDLALEARQQIRESVAEGQALGPNLDRAMRLLDEIGAIGRYKFDTSPSSVRDNLPG